MKVICLNNTGDALRPFEYQPLGRDVFGRFGASAYTEYGELTIGREYLVMGVITFQSYVAYLIDDDGFIFTCPCQLFEIIDDRLNVEWHFRLIERDEETYPFVQAILGYSELCSDKESYKKLIVEKEKEAISIYLKRKLESLSRGL